MKSRKLVTLVAGILLSSSLMATNGMKMIGKTAKQSAMGGASIGFLAGASSIDSNPANIAFLEESAYQVNLSLMLPTVTYKNNSVMKIDGSKYNIDETAENQISLIPSMSYAKLQENSKFNWGIGLFSQGGMGASYNMQSPLMDNFYTGMGAGALAGQDYNYYSNIATGTVNVTASYKVNDKFAVGVSPTFMFSMLEMKTPYQVTNISMTEAGGMMEAMNTQAKTMMTGMMSDSSPEGIAALNGFLENGIPVYFKLDSTTATTFTGKLGTTYKVDEKLAFGLSYQPKSKLSFEGDYTAKNLAMLANSLSGTAKVEFYWPQEIGFGTSYKVNNKLFLAGDIKQIFWKDAMKEMTLEMEGFEKRAMPLNWDDQTIIALGAEYQLNDKFTVRGGYNYGSNPVPTNTTIPIFPAVVKHHWTFGCGHNWNDKLTTNFALEYVPVETSESISKHEVNYEVANSNSALEETILSFGMTYKLK